MNLAQFFEHWRITENPFRGEEARHDSVFARVGFDRDSAASIDGGAGIIPGVSTFHSDFEKIVGDLERPSTSIVFGEKGSGKTAIRLQIASRVAAHNQRHPHSKVLLVPYDDLNAVLDRYFRKVGGKTPQEALTKFRLVDHIDALLAQVTPRLVDAILATRPPPAPAEAPAQSGKAALGEEASYPLDLGSSGVEVRKAARRFDAQTKRDILLLQAVYDRPDGAEDRTTRVRRALRCGLPARTILWNVLAYVGWIPAAALFVYARFGEKSQGDQAILTYAFAALLGLYLLVLGKRLAWDNLSTMSAARRVRRQLRVIPRSDVSLARSLKQLAPTERDAGQLPMGDTDEARYAMLERLRRVLARFGYTGMMIVIDRVDEPTLVSGDPERMRAIIWPLLNNKFLQQQGLGVKLLLPIELRHALFKESSAFFQEARLDKQNLVERLSWTGPMLYDLCEARLRACRDPQAGPISLLDLFAEDVGGRDLVDALDQMHQPRDAFKFLYRCMAEHCSNVTAEEAQWRIPRLVLETVRKQESDRVQQLYRGIRPA